MNVDIIKLLNDLSDIQDAAEVTRLDFEERRTAILASIKSELDSLDVEFAPLLAVANDRIAALQSEIKAVVTAHGASVKGARLHAIYAKGRVTWDAKGLDGYSVAHPEITAFRNEGDPSVSIRAVR